MTKITFQAGRINFSSWNTDRYLTQDVSFGRKPKDAKLDSVYCPNSCSIFDSYYPSGDNTLAAAQTISYKKPQTTSVTQWASVNTIPKSRSGTPTSQGGCVPTKRTQKLPREGANYSTVITGSRETPPWRHHYTKFTPHCR